MNIVDLDKLSEMFWDGNFMEIHKDDIPSIPSAFEGMTNNEVHKAIFGFELDPRYLVTDDTCICGENCPVCPLYNKVCNNKNFAEWLDSPYKGVSE